MVRFNVILLLKITISENQYLPRGHILILQLFVTRTDLIRCSLTSRNRRKDRGNLREIDPNTRISREKTKKEIRPN